MTSSGNTNQGINAGIWAPSASHLSSGHHLRALWSSGLLSLFPSPFFPFLLFSPPPKTLPSFPPPLTVYPPHLLWASELPNAGTFCIYPPSRCLSPGVTTGAQLPSLLGQFPYKEFFPSGVLKSNYHYTTATRPWNFSGPSEWRLILVLFHPQPPSQQARASKLPNIIYCSPGMPTKLTTEALPKVARSGQPLPQPRLDTWPWFLKHLL